MSSELVQQSYDKLKECMPVRNSFHQKLAFNLYNKLSMGSPVPIDSLPDLLELSADEIKAKIDDLPGIYKNEKEEIIGFWGLAVGYDSPHSLTVDGVSTNTWCAWDALFIPEVIGKSAEVRLTCPVTGFVTKLEVSANGLKNINNQDAVISFILPEAFDNDVIKNFCHYIYGFKNKEVFEGWKNDGHENCFSFTLQEAYELGRLKNQFQFNEILGGVQ